MNEQNKIDYLNQLYFLFYCEPGNCNVNSDCCWNNRLNKLDNHLNKDLIDIIGNYILEPGNINRIIPLCSELININIDTVTDKDSILYIKIQDPLLLLGILHSLIDMKDSDNNNKKWKKLIQIISFYYNEKIELGIILDKTYNNSIFNINIQGLQNNKYIHFYRKNTHNNVISRIMIESSTGPRKITIDSEYLQTKWTNYQATWINEMSNYAIRFKGYSIKESSILNCKFQRSSNTPLYNNVSIIRKKIKYLRKNINDKIIGKNMLVNMKKELKCLYKELRKEVYKSSIQKNINISELENKEIDKQSKEYKDQIDNDVCLQFGQNKKDMYVLDVGYPFSICDGICLAITQLYFEEVIKPCK